jgi:hypothetical protein
VAGADQAHLCWQSGVDYISGLKSPALGKFLSVFREVQAVATKKKPQKSIN